MRKTTKQNSDAGSMAFPIINPHATGIDIGDLLIAVVVPVDRCPEPVKEFGAFTEDLFSIASWLKKCGVDFR